MPSNVDGVIMEMHDAFAEVIESSLLGWTSQSWQWNRFPIFGSLVSIDMGKRSLLGLVCQTHTGSMDPTRYPFPFKKTEQELMAEQPQIFEFLKTTFTCLAVGYVECNAINYLLAPEPAHIHAFVRQTPREIAACFFSSEHFLYMLFGTQGLHMTVPLDEVLLACLNYQKNLGIMTPERLRKYLQAYAILIGNDYRRLKFFTQRVQHLAIHELLPVV
jgi:hypothetical protein